MIPDGRPRRLGSIIFAWFRDMLKYLPFGCKIKVEHRWEGKGPKIEPKRRGIDKLKYLVKRETKNIAN